MESDDISEELLGYLTDTNFDEVANKGLNDDLQKEEKAGLFCSSHEPRGRYPTVSRHRVHKKRVSRFSGFIKWQSTLWRTEIATFTPF